MRDTTLRDHLVIVAQLPDFVLGKLDETSMRRVSRHLEVCAPCRDELATAIDVLALLTEAPPPPARVRGAILQRAAGEPAVAQPASLTEDARAKPITTGKVGRSMVASTKSQHLVASRSLVPRWALVAVSAAILLIIGLAGWGYEQRNGASVTANGPIPLVDESAIAYPLDDSDLPVSATGVVFAEPQGRMVYLMANGLPVLPQDRRYQVWLFTADDQQQSAGLLAVGAHGDLRAFVQTPAPFANYVGMALTAEPATGSAVPTSALVLGGSFPPGPGAALASPT